jgi:hypothetical protein
MSTEGLSLREEIGERRSKLRICVPFHAKVKGVDSMGSQFSIETVLDNVSANGLYLRMMPDVETGAQLSIDVGLYTTSRVTEDAPRFSVDGVVVRKEKRAGGAAGVAVSFSVAKFR